MYIYSPTINGFLFYAFTSKAFFNSPPVSDCQCLWAVVDGDTANCHLLLFGLSQQYPIGSDKVKTQTTLYRAVITMNGKF